MSPSLMMTTTRVDLALPQQLRQTRKEGNAQRNRMERPRAPDGAQLQTVGKLKTNSRRTDARRKEEEGNVRSRPQSDRHHVAEAFQEERVLSQKGSDQNTNGRTVHRQPVKSVKSAAEMAKDYIAYRLPCSTDVDSLCSNVQRENNFQVLFCLQRQPEAVSRECHQVLWQFKLGLTQDEGLDRTIAHWCSSEVSSNKCDTVKHGNGELLPCLLAIRRDMKSVNCQNILLRIQMIVFSDFRLIRGFVEDCRSDIEKFNCAKVEVLDRSLVEQIEVPQKSQGATIACLEMHIDDLSLACQKRLVQKEEQAASDINLDRALVQACQQELGTFCSHVPPKEPGGQYDCLFHHKFDRAVSKDCKKQIKRRQKIEGRDYKADYSFSKACKDDIELHHCAESNINYGFGRMAKIILCLDEASMDKSSQLSKDCQSQMLDAKERMMGDYELSHGLVDACHEDVNDYCKHEADSNEEGAVIECLMGKVTDDGNEDDESQPRMGAGKLKTGCAEELQKLIQRADPGSDYHIDHVLERACKPFINSDCPPDTGEGDAAVLSCLMEKADSDKMPSDCRKHLLHLQYFIARDFKLDHQLYSKCKDDAARVCKSAIMNPNGMTEMEGNAENIPPQMILACLYRADIEYEDNIDDNSHQVSRKCHTDILRVLRERALSIQLNPAIHEACLQDLGSFCPPSSDDSSEEFKCLQQNIDKVSLQCQQSLKEWTAAEAEDIRINKPLMRECKHPILKFCKEVVSEGAGKLVQCLVAHKNDKDVSQNCRQQIQSFQEISMKDKSFDFNLRKFCRNDGKRLCPNVKTRVQVLDCFKGVLMDGQKRTSISGDCLAQLKLALKEVGENFDFDTTLKDACSSDAQTLCNSVSPGDAEVVECLREHDAKRKVSERCHQQLHKEEKLEVNMPEVDYKLMTICKASISKFCEDASAKDLLYCLEDHKLNMGFDVGCQRVVTERQIEAGRTIDLDPRLLTACRMDIPKFCRNKKPQEGEVIPCLKNALDKRMSLSPTCKTAVQQKEKESLLNVHVDAQFFDACKQEKVLEKCLQLPSGAIDCLRHLFGSNKAGSAKEISNQKCIAEIGRLMNEGVADVHNDPLLFTSCALDLQQYCNDIPFGTGKKIICLLEVYTTNKPHKLSVECSQQVSLRVEMWDTAVKVAPPNSFPELASLILSSQARGAFLSTGTLVIVILLILGCYVGRKCRRRRKRGKKL